MKTSSRSCGERIKRYAQFLYLRIVRIRATPEQIARGLALGTFIGSLPIIPLQTIIIIPLAILFRASKLAGFIASFISNPINLIPFYMLLWYIGRLVLPTEEHLSLDLNHLSLLDIVHQGTAVFLRMCIGGIILGIPLSIAVYYLSLPVIRKYQDKRAQILLQNAKERKRRNDLVDEVEHIAISDDITHHK